MSKIMEINQIKSSVLNSINEQSNTGQADILTDMCVSLLNKRDHNNTLTIKIGILISLSRLIIQDNVSLVVITL